MTPVTVSAQNKLLTKELRELTGLGAWEGGSLPCRTANRSSISCVDGTRPRPSSFRAASLASISAWVGMDSAIHNNPREEIILLLKVKSYMYFSLKLYFILESDTEHLSKNLAQPWREWRVILQWLRDYPDANCYSFLPSPCLLHSLSPNYNTSIRVMSLEISWLGILGTGIEMSVI